MTPSASPRIPRELRSVIASEAGRELQRQSLLAFVVATHPGYSAGWVHRDLCARLERFAADVAAKRSPRLIISMPPRHGKTTIASERFPAWFLGRQPKGEVIAVSHSQAFAKRISRTARKLAGESAAVFPALRRSPIGAWAVVHWQTAGGGSFSAAGIGSGIAGTGADVLLIDDYVKDAKKANSQAARDDTEEWYRTDAYSRLSPGGGVLIIATRWHEDDLIGRLLAAQETGGDRWEVVAYPAIAEVDELYRRQGEALHPERWPVARLAQRKGAVGERVWSALYQGRPTPGDGYRYRRAWFGTVYAGDPLVIARTMDEQLISVDCAEVDADGNDYTVMQVWGRKGPKFYLLHQIRDRMEIAEQVAAFLRLVKQWPAARVRLIEVKSNGRALYQLVSAEVGGTIPVDPKGSKLDRSHLAEVAFESGQVELPGARYAPWVGAYVEEMVAFPLGAHDDQVDATSQALARWSDAAAASPLDRIRALQNALG